MRIAKALPEQFEITGVVTRSKEKAKRFSGEFGVRCYTTADELFVGSKPSFVVVCVGGSASVDITLDLLRKDMPVLLETPPARDYETLCRFHESLPKNALIQVAEQYSFQPMHSARLAYIAQGKLGTLQHAHISYTHGYHGIALMRKYLGIGYENAQITAKSFPVSVLEGFSREGEPKTERIVENMQTVAVLDFDGKTGLYNFEMNQHRSWVRSPIIQVKGERGEIFDNKIKYLKDYKTPIESEFIRKDLGDENFEGYDLKGIFADGGWYYNNPYRDSRLVDDEIAVAYCLASMDKYVQGGASFYSLEEASQDLYLSLMIEEAARSGIAVDTKTQMWAE